MNTTTVWLSYRPLRIGWCVAKGDFAAVERAISWNQCLWGGCYNPILDCDDAVESTTLIKNLRVDILLPVGSSPHIAAFIAKHPHLPNPFWSDRIFQVEKTTHPFCHVLDVFNLSQTQRVRRWPATIHSWDPGDPLHRLFLMKFGRYPDVTETAIDYLDLLRRDFRCTELTIPLGAEIPDLSPEVLTIANVSRLETRVHDWDMRSSTAQGIFIGQVDKFADVVDFWNLRCAGNKLFFYDVRFPTRYAALFPTWESSLKEIKGRGLGHSNIATMGHGEFHPPQSAHHVLQNHHHIDLSRSESTVGQRTKHAPEITISDTSVTGLLTHEDGSQILQFDLVGKHFSDQPHFLNQRLVVDVKTSGGLRGDRTTFAIPNLPQLNREFARDLMVQYDELRLSRESIGIIISATDDRDSLRAVDVDQVVERIFSLASYAVKPSAAGLAAKQMLRHLGGPQGARVFKISGVRRLIRQFGPRKSFSRKEALKLIGEKDAKDPQSDFKLHSDLFIEQRPINDPLTADAVFGYMIGKGLFRMGADLQCPQCRLPSWISLEGLAHTVTCELCGHQYGCARTLSQRNEFKFRRSGVLGAENNAFGSVPVALTIQQLDTALNSSSAAGGFTTSMEATPMHGIQAPCCEADFIWYGRDSHSDMVAVILAECKDHVPFDENDMRNLKSLASAFPSDYFRVYLLFSQLAPISAAQIALAKALNRKGQQRVILLGRDELEPYGVYERHNKTRKRPIYASCPQDLAEATEEIYFAEP